MATLSLARYQRVFHDVSRSRCTSFVRVEGSGASRASSTVKLHCVGLKSRWNIYRWLSPTKYFRIWRARAEESLARDTITLHNENLISHICVNNEISYLERSVPFVIDFFHNPWNSNNINREQAAWEFREFGFLNSINQKTIIELRTNLVCGSSSSFSLEVPLYRDSIYNRLHLHKTSPTSFFLYFRLRSSRAK